MNAIEMAIQAALGRMMSGLSERLPELLQNIPPDVLQHIGQIRDTALSFKAQLNRIENQNRLIMDHLKISAAPEKTETEDGQQRLLAQ